MKFGKNFQDFCVKNSFTKAEGIRILEQKLEKEESEIKE